ncbi:hypothetical protein F4779DRAFT_35270 [Xylariaceae sp. FL0662B]|nr:hypothetical protein F4779DRAFT_35270 [Xylariaceae sp. FL0662B]
MLMVSMTVILQQLGAQFSSVSSPGSACEPPSVVRQLEPRVEGLGIKPQTRETLHAMASGACQESAILDFLKDRELRKLTNQHQPRRPFSAICTYVYSGSCRPHIAHCVLAFDCGGGLRAREGVQ